MPSYRNLAGWDRGLRIAAGAGMLALAWSGRLDDLPDRVLEIFAWIPLLTGVIGWCPFYSLLGFSTLRTRSRE